MHTFRIKEGDARLGRKLRVRAPLDYPPVVDDQNLIRVLDRRKPMRDNNNRFISGKLVKCMLDLAFIFRIDRCRRLIEHHYGSILEQGARNRYSLTLSSGESIAAFAYNGIVTIGKCGNEIMATSSFGRFNNFPPRCAFGSKSDVCRNSVVK